MAIIQIEFAKIKGETKLFYFISGEATLLNCELSEAYQAYVENRA
nr:hypothetical protein [Pseudoalteromonas sp. SANK 73390]